MNRARVAVRAFHDVRQDHAELVCLGGPELFGKAITGAEVVREFHEQRVKLAFLDRDANAGRRLDPAQPCPGALVGFRHHETDGQPSAVFAPYRGLTASAFNQAQFIAQRGIGRTFAGQFTEVLCMFRRQLEVGRETIKNL